MGYSQMILLYFIFAVLALSVFLLTSRLSRRRRTVIALLVFVVLSAAMTIGIWVIDDRPAPGDQPYNPRK
jgi:hypothetical protein